ncbi:hypothetical protein ACSVDA_23170 [Cytobacillus sp. Hm23]
MTILHYFYNPVVTLTRRENYMYIQGKAVSITFLVNGFFVSGVAIVTNNLAYCYSFNDEKVQQILLVILFMF